MIKKSPRPPHFEGAAEEELPIILKVSLHIKLSVLSRDRANRSLILGIIPEHIGWIEQSGLIEGYLKCKGGGKW